MNSSQEIILKEKKNERINDCYQAREGFPDSSVGKEFACNAGDPTSIPRLGRSTGALILLNSFTSHVNIV